MEPELIIIGAFALFGCLFFLLFLLCFHQAFSSRENDTKRASTDDNTDHNHHHIININPSSIMAFHSSRFFNVKRLSRSFTAERSALIMPSILKEFSLEEIENATNKFSISNLIKEGHSGSIYRGLTSDDEEAAVVVVVKRIHPLNLITKPADCEKDFYISEMDVYGKVQDQSFLVPVLGQCLQNEEKILVYEYMPYGDLETILSKARVQSTNSNENVQLPPIAVNCTGALTEVMAIETQQRDQCDVIQSQANHEKEMPATKLSWQMRMRIARGVAEALVYLHHKNRPHLSHRNIEASSILLNKDFDVKLGSLSDAQKLENGELPAYDIYCYGKVLLDLISGLNISGNCRNEETQSWTQKCFDAITSTVTLSSIKEHHLLPILDPNLELNEDQVLEAIEVAKLAKLCMEPTSLQKLTMKRVLEMLPRDS